MLTNDSSFSEKRADVCEAQGPGGEEGCGEEARPAHEESQVKRPGCQMSARIARGCREFYAIIQYEFFLLVIAV